MPWPAASWQPLTIAADRRIAAMARSLKEAGAVGTMDELRAVVFVALLTGRDPELMAGFAAPGTGDGGGSDGPDDWPPGHGSWTDRPGARRLGQPDDAAVGVARRVRLAWRGCGIRPAGRRHLPRPGGPAAVGPGALVRDAHGPFRAGRRPCLRSCRARSARSARSAARPRRLETAGEPAGVAGTAQVHEIECGIWAISTRRPVTDPATCLGTW